MLKLPPNLASLVRLAAKDQGRYALHAIRVQETTDGYQVIVSDGRRMVIVTGPGLQDEPVPALAEAPYEAFEALVPAHEWGRILKGAKRHPAFAVLGKEATTFSVGSDLATVPNETGRFPDVERVVKESCCSLLTVRVGARMLAELLLVAAEFGAGDSREAGVTLHYGGKGRPLLITTHNEAGQKFQAAIMPLV